jgi:4-diphosphocytidyl-2C-methyl-D-erythritol kinase
MGAFARPIIAAICSFCLVGSSAAAQLSGPQIQALISGNSIYVKLYEPQNGADRGVIYYSADGAALYKPVRGPMWHGRWLIKENAACVDWAEQASNPCSSYVKRRGGITILNIATGRPRGVVTKVRRGNVEKLAL